MPDDSQRGDALEVKLRQQFGDLVERQSDAVCGVSFPGLTSRIFATLCAIEIPRTQLLWINTMIAFKFDWSAAACEFLVRDGPTGVLGRFVRNEGSLHLDLRVLVADPDASELGAMVHHAAETLTEMQRRLGERGWIIEL